MKIKNASYSGAKGRTSLIDLEIPEEFNGEIIIFIHGFMGFKDWGAWNLVQQFFVQENYGFCKFNTSHNGGTADNGIDFPDPESFGNNTYSKEIEDFKLVVQWLNDKVDQWNGHVIGHSKGGAIALIGGTQIEEISSISTWASISSIGERFPKGQLLKEWGKKGGRFVKNGRTHQELPQKFELFQDFLNHADDYDLQKICSQNEKPIFIAHGENDTTVEINNGRRLAEWANVKLCVIKNTDHVFGSKHPWESLKMSNSLNNLCKWTELFISKNEF
jgi:pimeloyl-ACP methyl ester carboxylesterase